MLNELLLIFKWVIINKLICFFGLYVTLLEKRGFFYVFVLEVVML